MYTLSVSKEEFKKMLIEKKIKQKQLAVIIGIDRTYLSQMTHGRAVSKLCAYAVCKAIDNELEIEDIFKFTNK